MNMKHQLADQLEGFKCDLAAHEKEVDRLKKLIKLTTNTMKELDKIEGVSSDENQPESAEG